MSSKKDWHNKNSLIIFKATGGKCTRCNLICKKVNEGTAHHTTYKPLNGVSVYDLSNEILIASGIIEWVCKKCHREIHETTSIDGITKIRGICYVCNRRYGHTERSKLLNIDKPMCKICFRRAVQVRKMRENGQGTLF